MRRLCSGEEEVVLLPGRHFRRSRSAAVGGGKPRRSSAGSRAPPRWPPVAAGIPLGATAPQLSSGRHTSRLFLGSSVQLLAPTLANTLQIGPVSGSWCLMASVLEEEELLLPKLQPGKHIC